MILDTMNETAPVSKAAVPVRYQPASDEIIAAGLWRGKFHCLEKEEKGRINAHVCTHDFSPGSWLMCH